MSKKITVIDYGLGNLASVGNALSYLGIPYEISDEVSRLKKADALLLPGVGAAGQGMKNLADRSFDKIIAKKVAQGTSILGICLGMQLFLSSSEEGDVDCLGLVKGKVRKFKKILKVPQIGWNQVGGKNSKLRIMKDIPPESFFYFVNSYFCDLKDKTLLTGITEYGGNFCSVFEKENIFGVQFHPEKSGEVGLQVLKNFWEAL